MSWSEESWQQAARDYHAGRKHGRRQGNNHMDFGRESPAAEIIPLGKHREQPEEIRPPTFSDDALALRFIDQHKDTLQSPVWESGSDGMASVGVSTRD